MVLILARGGSAATALRKAVTEENETHDLPPRGETHRVVPRVAHDTVLPIAVQVAVVAERVRVLESAVRKAQATDVREGPATAIPRAKRPRPNFIFLSYQRS